MSFAERLKSVSASAEVATRADEFVTIARAIASCGGIGSALREARAFNLGQRQIEVMERAAIAPGTLAGSSALAQALVVAFTASLRNSGAFDRMLPFMVSAPPVTKIAVITSAATGAVIGEGQTKRVSQLALASQELAPRKAVAIVVASEELLRSLTPEAQQLFATELRGAVAAATDLEFIAEATGGTVPIPSSGGSGNALRQDLRALLQNVATGANSALFWLTTPTIAKALSAISDPSGSSAFPDARWDGSGSIFGIPLLISDSVTNGQIVLIDARGFAGSSFDVELDASSQALLQLNDAPDSPPVAATTLTSLWQHNLSALRATRYFGCERLRTSAVAIVTGVNVTGNSPP